MINFVFDDINVNKKIYENKQGIKLNGIIIKNIVASNKIKINDKIVNIILDILLMIMLFL